MQKLHWQLLNATFTNVENEEKIDFFKNFKKLFYIGVGLIYNVLLVSGVQQSDSVICVLHVSILFPSSFPI